MENKQVDLLDEDRPISGQKFVCVSFISPENIIKQKEHFFFEKFLNHFEFSKSMEKFHQFLNFVSYKYNVDFNKLSDDFKEFVSEEHEQLKKSNINDDYKNFLDNKEEELETEFKEKFTLQTSVRGVKIRGSFGSQEEAELRAKLLRENDPNHDIYVGPVGIWIPWEPEAYKTGRVEYIEKELNQLMNEKYKNEELAKSEFDSRVKEAKHNAIEENKKLALETGNKLTQNIDENGELVGIAGMNTTESTIKEQGNNSVRNIKKELFESENVILKKK